jgi:membrane protease YdiL (CAAX protease family)
MTDGELLTHASISGACAGAGTGSLARIEAHEPHPAVDEPSAPPRTSTASAVLGAIALVLAFVIVQMLAFALLHALGGDVDVDGGLSATDALSIVAVQVAGVLVVVLAAARTGAAGWRRLGVTGSGSTAFVRGWTLLLPAGLVVVVPTLLWSLVDGDVVDDGITIGSALAFVLLALAIALNEELWFRGLVVDRLQAAGRPWLTVLLGSVLFGLPHVGGTAATWLNAAAVMLAVAVPFTVVRLHVRSLWPMVAWHATIDAWAFLHTASVVAEGEPSLAELLAGLALPTIVACGYLLWFARRERAAAAAITP